MLHFLETGLIEYGLILGKVNRESQAFSLTAAGYYSLFSCVLRII